MRHMLYYWLTLSIMGAFMYGIGILLGSGYTILGLGVFLSPLFIITSIMSYIRV